MPGIVISRELVGRRVRVASRPEWGAGTVLRVQETRVGDYPVHRVSIQFPTGHRQIVVPPARLIPPEEEPQRQAGWLDTLAGRTLDDRLTQVPPETRDVLGTPAQRLAAVLPLYEHGEEPSALVQWARRQANVADPLSHWSRDELLLAFRRFCLERDALLRVLAAQLKQSEGPEALQRTLEGLPDTIREGVLAALHRPL